MTAIDALAIGQAVRYLGGGRASKGDVVDTGVGAELLVREGDAVEPGTPWIRLVHRDGRGLAEAVQVLEHGCTVGEARSKTAPVVLDVLPARER